MRAVTRVRLTLTLFLATTAACGSDDAEEDGDDDSEVVDAGSPDAAIDAAVRPVFRNPVDLPDDELAAAVLSMLGAPVADAQDSCDRCHGLTRQSVRFWRALGDQAQSNCLTDLEVTDPVVARTMIDCMREDPADPKSMFKANKLGVYSTGAHLPWFAYVFDLAFGEEGAAEHETFVSQLGMPRGSLEPFAQEQFDLVAEYFARGVPLLEALLPVEPPGECTPGVSADVAAHVDEMSLEGWAAVNAENGILMHGCGDAETPRECLAAAPRVEAWEFMAGAVVRNLRTIDYASSFWTRSSADGRFVGHGASGMSAIVDLQNDTVIPANALYDPGFFPDNSGFMFQSSQAHFCPQSILTATPAPAMVSFTEPGCSSSEAVGLYQHVGAALGGGDYFAVHGQFVSDNGGHDPTLGDPSATFAGNSRLFFTPMIHNGTEYEPGETVDVVSPFEGDAVISPSSRLVISRVAGEKGAQAGFVLRQVNTSTGPAGPQVDIPEIARYCVNGGKPGFSFDERWLTYHHYVEGTDADAIELGFEGVNDPAFAPYLTEGAANVYILDLLNGERRLVTRMAPGEYALFPHFRSDGWIYFIVRNLGENETIAATDAALVLGE